MRRANGKGEGLQCSRASYMSETGYGLQVLSTGAEMGRLYDIQPAHHLSTDGCAHNKCLPGAVEVGVDLGELEEAALVDGGAHGLLRGEVVVHAVHLA